MGGAILIMANMAEARIKETIASKLDSWFDSDRSWVAAMQWRPFRVPPCQGGRGWENSWQAEWPINQEKKGRKDTDIFRPWPNIGARFWPFVASKVISAPWNPRFNP
jgi:hypothetical protein